MKHIFNITKKALYIELPEYTTNDITGTLYALADPATLLETVTVTKQTTEVISVSEALEVDDYRIPLNSNPTSIERSDLVTIYDTNNIAEIHNVKEVGTNYVRLYETIQNAFTSSAKIASNMLVITWTYTLEEGKEYFIKLSYNSLKSRSKTIVVSGFASDYETDPPYSEADFMNNYRGIWDLVKDRINIVRLIKEKWEYIISNQIINFLESGFVVNTDMLIELLGLEIAYQILLGLGSDENIEIINKYDTKRRAILDQIIQQLTLFRGTGSIKPQRYSQNTAILIRRS